METTIPYRPLAGSISEWANTIQNLNECLQDLQLQISQGLPLVNTRNGSFSLDRLVEEVYNFRNDKDIHNYHQAASKLAHLIQKLPPEKTTLSSIIANLFACCLCSSSCIKNHQRQRILEDANGNTYELFRKQSSHEWDDMARATLNLVDK